MTPLLLTLHPLVIRDPLCALTPYGLQFCAWCRCWSRGDDCEVCA